LKFSAATRSRWSGDRRLDENDRVALFAAAALWVAGCGAGDDKPGPAGKGTAKAGRTAAAATTPAPILGPVEAELLQSGPAAPAPVPFAGGGAATALTLKGHAGEVTEVAFTPDGKFVVTASYGDFTLRSWSAADGAPVDSAKLGRRPQGLCITADGRVFIADTHRNLIERPIAEGKFGPAATHADAVGSSARIAAHPGGRLLAAASFDKSVVLWNVAQAKAIGKVDTPEGMRGVAFCAGAPLLAVGSRTNTVTLWDLRDGSGRTFTVPKVAADSDVWATALSADGSLLATGHMDSSITIWETAGPTALANFYVQGASTSAVAFSPDGALLATANGNNVHLWDARSGAAKGVLSGHTGRVRCLAFSPDGGTLASGAEDQTAILRRR
jgi:WD40 repeat protein